MFTVLLIASLLLPTARPLPLNSPLLPAYDYIVVGGGPAGLTVANRLSEDPAVNVLLLEAGPADAGEPAVTIPGFIGDDIGSTYDWNLSTVPQVYLDGLPRSLPQGHALGGGTILNGMLWSRGGQGDFQDWVDLGNPGWSWDDLLPYFIKSEKYTPVYSPAIAAQFSIQEYPEAHGVSGPVNVSFPKYFWNSSAVLFSALNEVGVPTATDPNTGWIAGASFLPIDVDPDLEVRSTARRAYFDPCVGRSNLWVSTNQAVTQILFANRPTDANSTDSVSDGSSSGQGGSPGVPGGIFGGTTTLNVTNAVSPNGFARKRRIFRRLWDWIGSKTSRTQIVRPRQSTTLPASDLVAVGVEFASNAQSVRQTVSVTREVIFAAGALHSPQILMLSGIGPAAALEALQIPVNIDLPGVGSNLQDHGQVWSWYPTYNPDYPNPTLLTDNQTFASEAWDEYWMNHTGPLTSGAIDGVAFPALAYIVNGSSVIPDAAADQSPEQYLPADIDSAVLNGYAQQHQLNTNALRDITRAAYELINANDGVLTVANMRPFSRGTVTLNSSLPFDPPIIDPRYGSNPVDVQVLQAALAFNQRLLYTSSLSQLDPVQMYPPADASEADVVQYINSKLQTEYHPAGTCAMMPVELGGVVNPELIVYGTRNLRVVDSSIMPMLPAAHLQAVVYGVAEKAADIIKASSAGSSFSSASTNSYSSSPSFSVEQSTSLASLMPATSTTFVTVVSTQTVFAS